MLLFLGEKGKEFPCPASAFVAGESDSFFQSCMDECYLNGLCFANLFAPYIHYNIHVLHRHSICIQCPLENF